MLTATQIRPVQGALVKPHPIYVDAEAGGVNAGSAWANAYADLQDALAAAVAGEQIWVAAGVYTPGEPGEISATFQQRDGVALYGGFASGDILDAALAFSNHGTLAISETAMIQLRIKAAINARVEKPAHL